MDRNPEQRDLIELMLGRQVAIKYVSGPDITDDNLDRVVDEGHILGGQPEARTGTFYLRAYSSFGIEVTREAQPGNDIFIPWGAVLAIWGPSRESLEREAPNLEQPGPSEESGQAQDRRELMDLLSSARTPSEVTNARTAADRWLTTYPGDGDVRLARERLQQSAYREEDLEEGSPT